MRLNLVTSSIFCQGFGFVKEDVFLGQGAARLKVGEGQFKQNDIK